MRPGQSGAKRKDRQLRITRLAGGRRGAGLWAKPWNRLRAAWRACRNDACLEPVAFLGDGFDVAAVLGRIAQCFPERKDVVGQVRFFDEGIRPDLLEELFLRDQPSRLLEQGHKDIERLRSERHGFSVAPQRPFPDIDQKRSELAAGRVAHVCAPVIRRSAPRRLARAVRRATGRQKSLKSRI